MSFGPVWAYTLTGAAGCVVVELAIVVDDVLEWRRFPLESLAPPLLQAASTSPQASTVPVTVRSLTPRSDRERVGTSEFLAAGRVQVRAAVRTGGREAVA